MLPVTFPNPFQRTSQPPLVVAVIPARYASTRLPGKPLAEIAGRPMIEHVYRRAADARGVDAVVVATDDERIARAVEAFGGIARMTHPGHRTGTDRVAEIALELSCPIVVNVQGDLPLLEPGMITDLVEPLMADSTLPMSTVCVPIDSSEEYANPNVVKVVRNAAGDAVYFSRSPIPYFRDGGPLPGREYRKMMRLRHAASGRDDHPNRAGAGLAFKHLGVYGFQRRFLLRFASLPQTPLEHAESLEQLRALEHGFRIRVVETQHESIEVDTPEDLERVRRLMAVEA